MKEISFKEKYVVYLVMICFIVIGLYYSYAIFVTKQLQENVVSLKTVEGSVKLNKKEYTIPKNNGIDISLNLMNDGIMDYHYEIYFKGEEEGLMVNSKSQDIKGLIKANEGKNILVNVSNKLDKEITIEFFVKASLEENFDLDIGYNYINDELNYDHTHANKPELGGLNLIPVAYQKVSDKEGFWYKVNQSNQEDLWYSYENGLWANAVLVSDENYQKYANVANHTEIAIGDILGFYVWIPRFKYVILNNYSYTNFERINHIIFEKDNDTTGSVSCFDKISNEEDSHVYSEACEDRKYGRIYDNLSTLTHPAFQDRKGFWVAKFLMNEQGDNLRSIPNASILKKNYQEAVNLIENSNLGHLLTNMEYASIVLLSNSYYGKSGNSHYVSNDNYTFKRIYNNNYVYDLTGCSSDYTNFSKVFNNDTSRTCIAYNDLENLAHASNSINYPIGEVGSGASTSGTINGVYDMANIYGELVSAFVGERENILVDNHNYIDYYSANDYLGIVSSSSNAYNLKRYKLGDAIKENFRTLSVNGMWQNGILNQKVNRGILLRGGDGDIKNSSIYTTSIVEEEYVAPFRVSLG